MPANAAIFENGRLVTVIGWFAAWPPFLNDV
jgi:hypothetical protein